MTHVLSRDVDGHLDMKLKLHHLEGGGVPVTHEVPDQTLLTPGRLGPVTVGHSGSLHDREVQILPGHVVDQTYETVIKNLFHV